MTITRQQFATLAPAASPETVDALFAGHAGEPPIIRRILGDYTIVEPHVIAQFLTVCHLASNGFTEFNRPPLIFGLTPHDWLSTIARDWHSHNLNEYADEWQWIPLVSYTAALYGFRLDDLAADALLADVCAALGVEDKSEEMALEDRGAMD